MKVIRVLYSASIIVMLISFIGNVGVGFIQGFNDGISGMTSSPQPSVLLYNMWLFSTLFFFIIKFIRYKFK